MHVNKSDKMNPEKYKRADPRFAGFHTKLFFLFFSKCIFLNEDTESYH